MSGFKRMAVAWVFVGAALGVALPSPGAPNEATSADRPEEKKYVSPEVARFERFVGPWSLTETHFDSAGKTVATVEGSEEIRWVLDRRIIQRTYISGAETALFRAIGMLGWNDVEKRYVGYWFNNASTSGPTRVTGEWNEDTQTMIFTLESSERNGKTVRYRVIERFLDDERRVATTYRLRGDEVIKRMEVNYRRAAPCPSGPRPIFDDALGRPDD